MQPKITKSNHNKEPQTVLDLPNETEMIGKPRFFLELDPSQSIFVCFCHYLFAIDTALTLVNQNYGMAESNSGMYSKHSSRCRSAPSPISRSSRLFFALSSVLIFVPGATGFHAGWTPRFLASLSPERQRLFPMRSSVETVSVKFTML